MSDFHPVERIAGPADAGVLILCDHASNALPPDYGDLGLPPEQFERHIAYDIGAAAMTRRLAARFGAPAVMTTFSRLLIDPNRGADDPTLVMRISDGALVPGDVRLAARDAALALVRLLVSRLGLVPGAAVTLASVAADLEIAQLVNDPYPTVTCALPLDVLDDPGALAG